MMICGENNWKRHKLRVREQGVGESPRVRYPVSVGFAFLHDAFVGWL
jgi:hypothetical protein